MFENEIQSIRDILIDILGEPKSEPYSSGWQSFNCPYCAMNEGIECDNKYNLETNIEHGSIFHCWKCETKGKISKLIYDFGNNYYVNEYKNLINSIRSSLSYRLEDNNFIEQSIVENCVFLPKNVKKFNLNKDDNLAVHYLKTRGIDEKLIQKYNIMYTDETEEIFSYRNRIIIPSYNSNNELNYWVGRDYTGNNIVKYCNPKIPKTSIIFNEGLINWYEDITIVEGPFDHIVVPNSIPLLGKSLSHENILYQLLFNRTMANINIFLDDDATEYAVKIYKLLNDGRLRNKIRIITTPQGFDASLIYEKYKSKGIVSLLRSAHQIDEYTLQRFL